MRVAEKVEKASEISTLKGALSTHRLFDLSIAEATRKKMKEGSGKVVQKYGEICGHEARKQIEDDEEDEKTVVNMREKRLQKPWILKYEKVIRALNKRFNSS